MQNCARRATCENGAAFITGFRYLCTRCKDDNELSGGLLHMVPQVLQ
jgi:hypothetical protein